MKLGEYIRQARKAKFNSVKQYIEEAGITIKTSSMTAIENGQFHPSMEILQEIIKSLSLEIKQTIFLWLQEQLLPEFKPFFPVEDLTKEKDKAVNPDQITIVNKAHIDFFIKNRIARLILHYVYINGMNPIPHTELFSFFSKHPKKEIETAINKLSELGYITKTSKTHVKALSMFLYFPNKASDLKPLIDEIYADSFKNCNYHSKFNTKYGEYPEGYRNYKMRTLSIEQLNYVKYLLNQVFSEIHNLPNGPGHEYFIGVGIGALKEDKA